MKIGIRNICVGKKRSKRKVEKSREYRSVEHLTVGSKVVAAFTIIFKM
jgi:hypothetical protein